MAHPSDEVTRRDAAARRAEDLQELIEAMAHALRTQLGTVSNSAGLLRVSGADPATIARVAEILERTARAATEMVADMEELARLDGGLELQRGPVDGETIARRVIAEARPVAAQRGVELKLAPIAMPSRLVGDDARLRQALGRLVGHAVEHAQPGSTVAVFVELTESGACFAVEDHGPSIPADQMPRIFESAGRRAPSRRRGGLGLGLAIARAIASAHGGTVRCDPSDQCTALFRLCLPSERPA